jgi:hypothetical protein
MLETGEDLGERMDAHAGRQGNIEESDALVAVLSRRERLVGGKWSRTTGHAMS